MDANSSFLKSEPVKIHPWDRSFKIWNGFIVFIIFALILVHFSEVFRALITQVTNDRSLYWSPDFAYVDRESTLQYLLFLGVSFALFFWARRWALFLWLALIGFFWLRAEAWSSGLASLAVFAASFPLGSFILGALKNRPEDPQSSFFYSVFTGFVVNSLILWILQHFPVNSPGSYKLLGLAEFCLFIFPQRRRELVAFLKDIPRESLSLVLLWAWSLGALLLTLHGTYGADDLVKHLHLPKSTMLQGIWNFTPHFTGSLDVSIVPQSLFAWVFGIGGEGGVRILNWLFFVFGAQYLLIQIQRRWSERVAVFAGAVMIATPFLSWILNIVFTDMGNFFAAVAIVGGWLTLIFSPPTRISVGVLVLSLSGGLLFKQQTVYLIFPSLLLLAYSWWRLKDSKERFLSLLPGLVGTLPLLSVFAANYQVSGNPIFPLFNGFFRSPYFEIANFRDVKWVHPLTPLNFFRKNSFETHLFGETRRFYFGFFVFVFQSLAAVLFLVRGKIGSSGYSRLPLLFLFILTAIGLFLWWKITGTYIRYFICLLPAVALSLGLFFDVLWSELSLWGNARGRFFLKGLFAGAAVLIFAVGLAFQANGSHNRRFDLADIGRLKVNHLMEGNLEAQGFQEYRHRRGPEARILLASFGGRIYFSDNPIEASSWMWQRNSMIFLESKSASELVQKIFTDRGFSSLAILKSDRSLIPTYDALLELCQIVFENEALIFLEPKSSEPTPGP